MVLGYKEPEKKEKAATKTSLFFYDNTKESPYLKDAESGEKATWLDVDHAVMEAMTDRGLAWDSLAECQRKGPATDFQALGGDRRVTEPVSFTVREVKEIGQTGKHRRDRSNQRATGCGPFTAFTE